MLVKRANSTTECGNDTVQITAWPQEHCRKLLSVNTVCCCSQKVKTLPE